MGAEILQGNSPNSPIMGMTAGGWCYPHSGEEHTINSFPQPCCFFKAKGIVCHLRVCPVPREGEESSRVQRRS